jgi:hypothetical protein
MAAHSVPCWRRRTLLSVRIMRAGPASRIKPRRTIDFQPETCPATHRVLAMTEKQVELRLRYAWDWFSYHARQRLTAFNFFLIVMGAVVVGYTQAIESHLPALGVSLGVLGAFVALAFWAMDIRNEELVNCGRVALDEVEQELKLSIRSDDRDRKYLANAMRGRVEKRLYRWLGQEWFTHRRWLRAVIIGIGSLSLAAGAWAGVGFPGSSHAHQEVVLVSDQRHHHSQPSAPPRTARRPCDKTRQRHSSARRSQSRWTSTCAPASFRRRVSCRHS